jgi:hypothetical protein
VVTKLPEFGAIQRAYIGDASGSGVLTLIRAQRTLGSQWHLNMPTAFEPVAGKKIQSGLITCTFTLTFMDVDDQTTRLAIGNSLSQTNIDDPISNEQFTLLVLAPKQTGYRSFLFPSVQADINAFLNFAKDDGSRVPLTFSAIVDDVSQMNEQIYRQGSWSKLKGILDTRSPI